MAAESKIEHDYADDVAVERFSADIEVAAAKFGQDVEHALDELMTAADEVADASFTSLDDVIEKWSQLSPQTLLATVQRDGLFVGHGGARHDMNADIAQSFLVALYPAWTSFFEQASAPADPPVARPELVAGTERALAELGATERADVHSRFFEREALGADRS